MDRHALFLHIIARLKAVYAKKGLLLTGDMITTSRQYDYYIRVI